MKQLVFCLAFLVCLTKWISAQSDRSGCGDHPLLTRYPGSVLAWCDYEQFQSYHIAIGPQTGYRQIDEWVEASGQVHRLYYERSGDRSMTEVYRNYLQAVKQGGFDILAQGLHPQTNVSKEVGGRTWLGTAYAANPLPRSEGLNLFHGSSTSGGTAYLAAKLSRTGGTVYLTLMAYQHTQDEVLVQLDIIEVDEMDGEMVQVDADYLAQSLQTYGKVALYGLFFDPDRATLTEASEPALHQIALLLQRQPQLQLYVVGHTDLDGELGYNLDLAMRRAAAVVEVLANQHGIARSRLVAKGVGPLVPVMTNRREAGKARNRRVELVER